MASVALDANHRTEYYWGNGRLTNVTAIVNGITNRFDYAYLANSDLLQTTVYLDGTATVHRTYDDLNRLLSISATSAVSAVNSFTYTLDSTGRRTARADLDSASLSWGYDPYDQLTSATRTNGPNGAAAAAYDFGYQYDEVGNRLHEDRKAFDLDATFNALNQLTYRDWSGRLAVYGSVDDTNAVMIVGGVTSAPPYFNSTNWLGGGAVNSAGSNSIPIVANVGTNSTQTNLAVCMPPKKPQEFLWDPNGNLTNDGYRAYSWNEENRLVEIQTTDDADGTDKKKSEFIYDGMGRRSQKTDYSGWNGSTYSTTNVTTFVYDGWNLILETSSAVTNHYVWGLDVSQSLQGAGGIGGLLCVVRNGTPYFPCFDGNGNVTDYIDQTGAVVAHREYDPFGRTLVSTGPMKDSFSFWFSTKYEEPFWGLYYFGFRYYHPETGRWLSQDPIGELGSCSWRHRRERRRQLVRILGFAVAGRAMTQSEIRYAIAVGGPNIYAFCANNGINFYDAYGEGLSLRCGWLALRHATLKIQVLDTAAQKVMWEAALFACQPGGPPEPTIPGLIIIIGCEVIKATAPGIIDALDEEFWDLIDEIADVEREAQDLGCCWAGEPGEIP